MMRTKRQGLTVLIVGACLGLPAAVSAGPFVNLMQPCDCPPNHYSAMHVLTPAFYRWAAWCQGPCRYTFAKDQTPCVPPTTNFNPYHCPASNPLQYSMDHYVGLSGGPPRSTYQPRQQPASKASPNRPSAESQQPDKEAQPGPPQLLPPPREEPEKK